MERPILLLLLCACCYCGNAQIKTRYRELSVSVSNNAVAMPFSGRGGIIHKPIHPGLTMGYGKQINRNDKHVVMLNWKAGYVFQERVQHAVQIYPELGYRLKTRIGIGADTKLGLGYMHSFTDLQQFKLGKNGEYERYGRGGRPSVMASWWLGLGYDLGSKTTLPLYAYLGYQAWFQSPYVRSYVPVLPNGALHVGAAYSLKAK